jgi:glycosyltransferase involved in cell wall biosynthesis
VKVLVVNNMAPFVRGGAEALAEHLRNNLEASGHQAEILRIPFRWDPATGLIAQMLMVRAFELDNVDRVIALKFPAYLIRHSDKRMWLLHQYRQAYDLYDAGYSNIPSDADGEEIRRVIKHADADAFRESRRIFVNSVVTRDRLAHYNGVASELLPPPLNDEELFAGEASEGYVFVGGRINAMKRQHLMIEALALAPKSVRLVIAGPPDSADDAGRLRQAVEVLGLSDRVTLDLRFVPRSELARYVNRAAAVACLPYDEDSLSYVAMEAAAAGKAIISTNDSGGVLGLARHMETGWVTDPTRASLADALAALAESPARAAELGSSARQLWTEMGITWPKTIERLMS